VPTKQPDIEPPDPGDPDLSLTVLVGRVTNEPERRELPSGSIVLSFDVAVRPTGGAAESVPVAWTDPPARARVRPDDTVVVVGRTRRRFFRTGGATAARTEVVADRVVSRRSRERFEGALADAADQVASAVEALRPSA
jgi:single-strand DNA-binding protein